MYLYVRSFLLCLLAAPPHVFLSASSSFERKKLKSKQRSMLKPTKINKRKKQNQIKGNRN